MKKILLLITLLTQLLMSNWAYAFIVKNIEIQGLQNISPLTVESYLPIKRGQNLQPAKSAEILRSLYKTGFFDSISLSQANNTLIIHVVERPIIGSLKITGNSIVPTDKLTSVMKSVDIAEGRVYNPATIEKIKQSLLNQYYQMGHYNARINVITSPMPRNRVSVKIDISEGLTAKIRRITIIGNKVFDEKTLTKQLDVSTSGLFSFITQSDRYSEERLTASLDKLRTYYMDHGYLRVELKSSQAEVTPDRKSVYITVIVDEGKPYIIKSYDITGHLVLPKSEYIKKINIQPGETFSRQKVIDAEKALTKLLGDNGYLFANVNLRPQVNDENHTVILQFDITPGKRAYVRHVTFSENNRTNDVVLRREVTQMEAALASTSKLDDSKRRIGLLPYIKNVDMSVAPGEEDDQVDVNYKVQEDSSAQASFKIGYSGQYGYILGAGLNQPNFLGTGNALGLNVSKSKVEEFFGIDYTNPYYTEDGISRSFNFSVSRVDPGEISNVNNGYTTNEYSAGVLYGIPIGDQSDVFNRIQVGANYQNILVKLTGSTLSNQINQYITNHGRHFQELDLKLGYSRDSRDKAVFPTSGALQTLFFDGYAPLDSNSITFYNINYHGRWYQPITDQYIILSRANLGYGNALHGAKDYPFFKNYFAGGIDSVRGYQTSILGPLDSNGQAYGGNMLADASVGLIFPNYISDNLRTTVFVDAGNVYSSLNNRDFGGKSTNSGPIRYSVGVEAGMLTPFGPVEVSVAQAINPRDRNDIDYLQFTMGANF